MQPGARSTVLPFLTSFLVTLAVTPIVIWAAHRRGWVARPRADRWHSRPTAVMGGIALFVGTAAGYAIAGSEAVNPALAVPAALMFLLGALDDRLVLSPAVKMAGQLVAGSLIYAMGIRFEQVPPVLGFVLTLFWVMAITNAVNLLDNMDGLAAGVVLIGAVGLATYCGSVGAGEVVLPALSLAGACGGFLVYNFNPARIFMGDCGSLFLGLWLGALAVRGTHASPPDPLLSLLVHGAVLAIPVFDTTLVSLSRLLHRRSILRGGKDHSSHRLVRLGLTERGAVGVLYGLAVLYAAFPMAVRNWPREMILPAAVLSVTGLAALGLYLGLVPVYGKDSQ